MHTVAHETIQIPALQIRLKFNPQSEELVDDVLAQFCTQTLGILVQVSLQLALKETFPLLQQYHGKEVKQRVKCK